MPTIHSITRQTGRVGGQFAITATIQHTGEPVSTVAFVGSIYGAPIVMVTESNMQVFVDRNVMPELTEANVRAFFKD